MLPRVVATALPRTAPSAARRCAPLWATASRATARQLWTTPSCSAADKSGVGAPGLGRDAAGHLGGGAQLGNQSPIHGDQLMPSGDEMGRVRSLIFRSKQRGSLELDLMLGEFAYAALPGFSSEELDAWEDVLDVENPDLFRYLSEQEPVPKHYVTALGGTVQLSDNAPLKALFEYIKKNNRMASGVWDRNLG